MPIAVAVGAEEGILVFQIPCIKRPDAFVQFNTVVAAAKLGKTSDVLPRNIQCLVWRSSMSQRTIAYLYCVLAKFPVFAAQTVSSSRSNHETILGFYG